MAASTTMRPHSATSSGSSTPWLSPEASSHAWSASYATSADLSRRSSSGSTSARQTMSSDPSSSHGSHSQEWWEHVLPPGQLAERLRKAQRSSSASRRRNNPALANATPSERSAWKRLSGLSKESSHERSDMSTAASSRRSSFQSGAATFPRSAMRPSSCSQEGASFHLHDTSAEVSSDEHGSISSGQQTPQKHVRYAFPSGLPAAHEHASSSRHSGVRTTSNSPEMNSSTWSTTPMVSPPLPSAFDQSRSGSRTTHARRMRVMSEDGMATNFFASSQSTSSHRIPNSQSAVHLNTYTTTESGSWMHSPSDRVRARFNSNSLPDTPELSSDENADNASVSTTTTQRVRKTSTTRTTVRTSSKTSSPPTILRSHFDRPDQAPCPLGGDETDGSSSSRRGRHVSFDQATEIPRRASVEEYSESIPASQSAFSFGSQSNPFDSLPPRSNSTRRSRQGVRISGRRTTSFSLPGSRRGSIHEHTPHYFASQGVHSSTAGHRRTSSIPDAMILDSLNVAHKQLASAGNLALTLTRQLSAPLRPVFHMTLFLSISSITVLSLACFLCASYMLTAWDDVSKRTQKVGVVAGKTVNKFERTLNWGMRMLDPESSTRSGSKPGRTQSQPAFESRSPRKPSSSGSSGATESALRSTVACAGHAFFWPARMAWSATSTVAYRVTPTSISKMFESNPTKPKSSSTLPPRPPLSTLLPSILFTLMLAIGAGLTSFLASRRAASDAAATGMPRPHHEAAQPYHVPSSHPASPAGMEYVHLPASPAASPFVGKRAADAWEKDGKRRGYTAFA